ncbi:efflux RND transporter periplasmic adaptor subunit [Rhodopirellula sp. P2]|uniref:efflux RND transporter periplasmic adaptor subunit n=1 Tax=Rhodopirellula sp. P2 TaxID=2127060 RepID=UPI0023682BB6|nr:efflux RND transporter periplasmic adaptor subunit [Rhodopirellula sp. P2]WDQ16192.1 efflux RND transporter periplasmic adaptor subunit [Rhodopirellula sp. P2]
MLLAIPPRLSLPLATVAALCFLTGCSDADRVAKKTQTQRATPVKTVSVTPTKVTRTSVQPATIHAYYRAELRSQASGYVESFTSDIGEYVESGTVLAKISVPEKLQQRRVMEARIRRLVAQEKQAAAGVRLAEAAKRSAQAKLAQAKSEGAAVDASLAAANAEFNRTEDLVNRGSLQNRMLDEARMKRDSESARKQAVESAVASAQADVEVASAKVESAQADLETAQAETDVTRRELDELDVWIDYAEIKAPFSGIITERNLEPGDLVRASSEVGLGKPLFAISQIDRVRVQIPVPENHAPLVNPGDEVSLTFPSFASEPPLIAQVTRRSGSLDAQTRTMLVEVEIDNPDGKLIPGMFGQASIQLATQTAANLLPAQAIRFDESGSAFVYVVAADDTISIQEISTGVDDGNFIEVLTGVEPGQAVVDAHLSRFIDGQKVAVVGATH